MSSLTSAWIGRAAPSMRIAKRTPALCWPISRAAAARLSARSPPASMLTRRSITWPRPAATIWSALSSIFSIIARDGLSGGSWSTALWKRSVRLCTPCSRVSCSARAMRSRSSWRALSCARTRAVTWWMRHKYSRYSRYSSAAPAQSAIRYIERSDQQRGAHRVRVDGRFGQHRCQHFLVDEQVDHRIGVRHRRQRRWRQRREHRRQLVGQQQRVEQTVGRDRQEAVAQAFDGAGHRLRDVQLVEHFAGDDFLAGRLPVFRIFFKQAGEFVGAREQVKAAHFVDDG